MADALTRPPAARAGAREPALERELARVAEAMDADVLVVADEEGLVVASSGPRSTAWAAGQPARDAEATIGGNGAERIERRAGAIFRVVSAPMRFGPAISGELYVATVLDDGEAASLSGLARCDVALLLGNQAIGTTLPVTARNGFASLVGTLPEGEALDLGGSRYILKTVRYLGPIRYIAAVPLESRKGGIGGTSPMTLVLIGLGALLLSAAASFWVARSIARPIDTLSQQLTTMARARDFSRQLAVTGSSREVDGLSETFNQMMAAVAAADARRSSPTSARSRRSPRRSIAVTRTPPATPERVSTLSVMVGREMRLNNEDLECSGSGRCSTTSERSAFATTCSRRPGRSRRRSSTSSRRTRQSGRTSFVKSRSLPAAPDRGTPPRTA